MNIQQLQYIIALDRYKNFTKASESCFITQATLSTMIRRLEEELNVVLFDRKTNPVITTEIGKEIIKEAEKALVHIQNINSLPNQNTSQPKGEVRIGIIPTIGNSLLPIILKPILEAYPQIELSILELTTENIIGQLRDYRLDFGIISTPIQQTDFHTDILYYEPLKVYGDLGANKRYVLTSDLSEETHWLLEDGHCIRDQVMHYCSLQNKSQLPQNLKFESGSFETLLNMVDSFGGLTILPELYVNTLSQKRKERILEFASPAPVREVSLISYRPEAKRNIGDLISEKIKSLVKPVINPDLRKSIILKAK